MEGEKAVGCESLITVLLYDKSTCTGQKVCMDFHQGDWPCATSYLC